MDFENFEFPCSIDVNVYKAFFGTKLYRVPKEDKSKRRLHAFAIDWNAHLPKSLRRLALEKIVEYWIDLRYYEEIPRQADKNFILNNLDANVPLKISSTHIKDDFFWKKSYQHRWKTLAYNIDSQPWINIYMERHLQEYLENTEVYDYDLEAIHNVLDTCGPYVNRLQIDHLRTTMGERNDHIPLDYVLSNLPELTSVRVTYCTKTIGTDFFLGCSSFSRNDILSFARGLSRCSELREFWLHSVKLEPYQMACISRALDNGCPHLCKLSITRCAMRDEGLQQFVEVCTKDCFENLRILDLTSNLITSEGSFILSKVLRGRHLEKLILRLNPLESDGAMAIFQVSQQLALKELDLSGCCLSDTLTRTMLELLLKNDILTKLDISNNLFTEEFGQKVCKTVGFNNTLRHLDLRGTGVTVKTRNKIKEILKLNKNS